MKMSGEFWFVDQRNIERGPVAKSDIIKMIDAGQLGPETQIWTDPMPDWRRADRIDGFSSLFVLSTSPPNRPSARPPGRLSPEQAQRIRSQEQAQRTKEEMKDGKHRFLCRSCNAIVLDAESRDHTGGELTGSFSITSGALPGSYSATANRTATRIKQRPCRQCKEPKPRDVTMLTIVGTLALLIGAFAAGILSDTYVFSCKNVGSTMFPIYEHGCRPPGAFLEFLGVGLAAIFGGIIAMGIAAALVGELYLKPTETRAVMALLEEQSRGSE
jgi:hypothetical protein